MHPYSKIRQRRIRWSMDTVFNILRIFLLCGGFLFLIPIGEVFSKEYTFTTQIDGAAFSDEDGYDFTLEGTYEGGIKLNQYPLLGNPTVQYTFIIPPNTAANYTSLKISIRGKATGPLGIDTKPYIYILATTRIVSLRATRKHMPKPLEILIPT